MRNVHSRHLNLDSSEIPLGDEPGDAPNCALVLSHGPRDEVRRWGPQGSEELFLRRSSDLVSALFHARHVSWRWTIEERWRRRPLLILAIETRRSLVRVQGFEHLDEFVGSVAILASEFNEFLQFGHDEPFFGAADHADTATSAHLHQSFVAQDP